MSKGAKLGWGLGAYVVIALIFAGVDYNVRNCHRYLSANSSDDAFCTRMLLVRAGFWPAISLVEGTIYATKGLRTVP